MEFIVNGSGNINIIFLHGWGADYKSFYFLKDLFKNCTLHFATLDGFGGVSAPQDISIKGYCQRLNDYIEYNKLKNIIIVAHSFGGRIAIEYASGHNVLGLMLVDSAGIKPRFNIKKHLKIVKYKIAKRKVIAGRMSPSKLENFGSIDYKNSNDQMKKVLNSCVKYNQKPLLTKINCPTLIVWGKKDKDTPIYMAKTLHNGIKNSKLVVMKDCGHFCFLDNQYQFFKLLDEFIRQRRL